MFYQKLYLYKSFVAGDKHSSRWLNYITRRKGVTIYLTTHQKDLVRQFLPFVNKNSAIKKFLITDTTKNRIETMDVSNSTKVLDCPLDREVGFVAFNDGLHFVYSITDNDIHILIGRGHVLKHSPDPEFEIKKCMVGYYYFNKISKQETVYLNSDLDILRDDGEINLLSQDYNVITELRKSSKLANYSENAVKDYKEKFGLVVLCLKAFMFIHFAKVVNKTFITEDRICKFSDRIKNKKKNNIEIIKVDTFYDENIDVISPFLVSGHWRNQSYGKEMAFKKYIYIDSFMKSGYHREATIKSVNKKT